MNPSMAVQRLEHTEMRKKPGSKSTFKVKKSLYWHLLDSKRRMSIKEGKEVLKGSCLPRNGGVITPI